MSTAQYTDPAEARPDHIQACPTVFCPAVAVGITSAPTAFDADTTANGDANGQQPI
ncbi:hypothetical protein FRB90_009918 [Tulasnella sp. 427]|nr:hypothetical protein FRB90_009918 [Tulasnella sp. 427]